MMLTSSYIISSGAVSVPLNSIYNCEEKQVKTGLDGSPTTVDYAWMRDKKCATNDPMKYQQRESYDDLVVVKSSPGQYYSHVYSYNKYRYNLQYNHTSTIACNKIK